MTQQSTPAVEDAPDGTTPGAFDRGDGSTIFALYAPGKQSIHLIGDFNDWQPDADPLNVTEAGLWWIARQLEPGQYHYKFVVDGSTEIADPYARRLSEDGTPLVVVGGEPYSWGDSGWDRPPFSDLVIYELHIGDFSAPYTYRSVTDKLPYLRDLGINAIELLPVFGFGGKPGWGYDPLFFFAPEQTYGSPEDLKELIDQAHQHGIAVILDVVFAHTSQDHAFNKLYPYDQSPWYGENNMSEQNQFGFPKFDHTRPATKDFMRDVQNYWINEYHIDGFRYDYTRGIGYNMQDGVSYLAFSARQAMPNLYLIAEESPEKPEIVRDNNLNGAWHVRFNYIAKALLREGQYLDWDWDNADQWPALWDAKQQGYSDPSQMVNYFESHDESRAIFEVLTVEGQTEEAARYKSALGATLLMTVPGVPMLLHGQEWGENTEKTSSHNPLHWELLDTDGGLGLKTLYQAVIGTRRDHPALRGPNIAIDHCSAEHKTLVFHRWNDEGDVVVVGLNFCPADQQIEVEFPGSGRWRDVLSGQEFDIDGGYVLHLGPSQGRVMVKL
ncbi:MAG TPA: alpha-amylase family glycosyl hydrolase [Herpetosiphonaceae bacterium]